MPPAHNARGGARIQRAAGAAAGGGGGGAAAAAGCGNGEPAAPVAAAAGFGLGLRGTLRCGLRGGGVGCNSPTTGFGSIVVVAGVVKSPGVRTTCTGTVSGSNLGSEYVTEKLSVAGTATEHGVLQPGPTDVRASAPGGTDSSWTVTVGGVGLNESMENDEQPARPRPATEITMKRRMLNPSNLMRLTATVPAVTIEVSEPARNRAGGDRHEMVNAVAPTFGSVIYIS